MRYHNRVHGCLLMASLTAGCGVADRHVQIDRPGGSAGTAGAGGTRTQGGGAGASFVVTRAGTAGRESSGDLPFAGNAGATATAIPFGGSPVTDGTAGAGASISSGGSSDIGQGGTTAASIGGMPSGGIPIGGTISGGVANGGATTRTVTTGGNATGGAATGGASYWCDTQTIPSGVVAADYQCLDFDRGMPSTTTWPQTIANSGTMALTTAKAFSSPNSLAVSVPSADTYATAGKATATWQVVGSNPIARVSLTASLNPPQSPSMVPAWTGRVELLCVGFGYGEACLVYTYGAELIDSGVAYYGYALSLMYSGGPAFINFKAVTGTMTPNIWTRVELRVTKGTSNVVQVFFNGTEVANETSTFAADTVAKFTYGVDTTAAISGWTMHYDNVVAAVSR